MNIVEMKARRFFKDPEVFAKGFHKVIPNTATLLLDRNKFRIRAIIYGDSQSLWISHSKDGVARAADRFIADQGGNVGYVITSQQEVWAISTAGTEAFDVWEEYWDEGSNKP